MTIRFVKITKILGLLAVCLALIWTLLPNFILSIRSPNQEYQIDLINDNSVVLLLLGEVAVNFDLYKNGEEYAISERLYSADGFRRMDLRYPEFLWIGDACLRFFSEQNRLHDSSSKIFIKNNSGMPIKYLLVEAQDLFLILDINNHEELEFEVPYQKWQSWVNVSGTYVNGHRMKNGHNFDHRDSWGNQIIYCVSITENSVVISSPMNDKLLDAQKALDCNS